MISNGIPKLAALGLALLLFTGAAVAGENADAGAAVKSEDVPVQFAFKKHPSMRVGDWLKIDFRAKIQTDLRSFSPQLNADEDFFDPRRVRLGVQGRLFQDLEFELEYEMLPVDHQLRDAFLNYRKIRELQVQAGKFKMPFGLDQLTGPMDLAFVHRSRIGSQLAPGRSNGIMLHGNLLESGLRYQAGIFQHDGENAEAQGNLATGRGTVAGRVTAVPASILNLTPVLRGLEIGAAFTHGQVEEGRNSLWGRTASGESFYSRLNVAGARTRQGAEMSWLLGSLFLSGEYMNVREQRRQQGLAGNDLSDLLARGWYLSATHPLFGKRTNPQQRGLLRSMIPGTRPGLVEAAARYEQIRFGSDASSSLAPRSRSPRAANVLGNSDRALTLGINWYANRFAKFQFNAVRETLEDAIRTPVNGRQNFWMFVGRLQFVL